VTPIAPPFESTHQAFLLKSIPYGWEFNSIVELLIRMFELWVQFPVKTTKMKSTV
jgi:hypothetical protein